MSIKDFELRINSKMIGAIVGLISIFYSTYSGISWITNLNHKVLVVEGLGLEFQSYKRELGDVIIDMNRKLDQAHFTKDQYIKFEKKMEEISKDITDIKIAQNRLDDRYSRLEKEGLN